MSSTSKGSKSKGPHRKPAQVTTAHRITSAKPRTQDVLCDENSDKDFTYLQLSESMYNGVVNAGFRRPSPIQMKAIPLGKIGLDLVVQSKSGTGKTLVYIVIALEMIDTESNNLQAIAITPTREIAIQGARVALEVGSQMPDLKVHTFIGGMSVAEDKQKLRKCHLAIGTPGRIKQLLEEGSMNPESIRLFMLDEADKLMESSFKNDITWIFNKLPMNKQVLALSATYPESLEKLLTAYMRSPTHVRLGKENQVLKGLTQFVYVVKSHPNPQRQDRIKSEALQALLGCISFSQVLVFSKYMLRAQSLSQELDNKGWPAIFISSNQSQDRRLQAINSLKQFQCRVLLTTDLTARGIDAQNVNLVVNFEVPWDSNTYLHRIGRAGRFGSYGIAVTICSDGEEYESLRKIVFRTKSDIKVLPEELPNDLWKCRDEPYELVEGLDPGCEEEYGPEDFNGWKKEQAKSNKATVEKKKFVQNGGGKIRRRGKKRGAQEKDNKQDEETQKKDEESKALVISSLQSHFERLRTAERLVPTYQDVQKAVESGQLPTVDVPSSQMDVPDELSEAYKVMKSSEEASWASKVEARRKRMEYLTVNEILDKIRDGETFEEKEESEEEVELLENGHDVHSGDSAGGFPDIKVTRTVVKEESFGDRRARSVRPKEPRKSKTRIEEKESTRPKQTSRRPTPRFPESSSESEGDSTESDDEDEEEFLGAKRFPHPFPDPSVGVPRNYPKEWKVWFRQWYQQVRMNREYVEYMEYWKNVHSLQDE